MKKRLDIRGRYLDNKNVRQGKEVGFAKKQGRSVFVEVCSRANASAGDQSQSEERGQQCQIR
jgi:hypothetical protein